MREFERRILFYPASAACNVGPTTYGVSHPDWTFAANTGSFSFRTIRAYVLP